MPINSYEDYFLSWKPDRNRLKRPIYVSLIKQLEEDILSGQLSKNTRLPSQRELADYLDINFTTVGQAYRYGIEKGLLYTNIGSGTFISQNAFNNITISNNDVAKTTIDLGLVSSFEECNELIVPYLNKVSAEKQVVDLLNYQEPIGSTYQRETAAWWLKTQGVITDWQNVGIVSGVQNGLAIALSALFVPGNRIAVDRYTYANFIELASILHLEIVLIDYDEEGMLLESLEKEYLKKKIHGVFLMPSCNNPMGFQMSLARRQELVQFFRKKHLWVIEDDIHSFLTTYLQGTVIPPFQALLPEQTIYLAGMTKYICSGLRIAYLVYPTRVKEQILKCIFNINVKTSGFDVEVVTRILHSETAQKILQRKLALTKEANRLFDTYFQLPRPSHPLPYYRVIPIDAALEAGWVEAFFLEKGVRVYHSSRFTIKNQPDAFIRLSLSSNRLEDLEAGFKIIQKEIKAFQ